MNSLKMELAFSPPDTKQKKMKKQFLGGSDVDLLTSLVDSFIYEEKGAEIYVTYLTLLRDSTVAYVSTGYFSKDSLLDAFHGWMEKDRFLASIGMSEQEFIDLPVQIMLCNCIWYYGWDEFGTDYYPYTLDEWHEMNRDSLDFSLEDIKEYLHEVYGVQF